MTTTTIPPEPDDRPKTVHQAIAAVIRDMPGIGKDSTGSGLNYSYRGIEQIKEALKPLLGEHGVHYSPVELVTVDDETYTVNSKPWRRTLIAVRWCIWGPDGSNILAMSRGEGADNSDKASNKAMTVAEKQMLLSVFAVADAEDPDNTRPPEADQQARPWGTIKQLKVNVRNRVAEALDGTGATDDDVRDVAREVWTRLGITLADDVDVNASEVTPTLDAAGTLAITVWSEPEDDPATFADEDAQEPLS